MGNYYFISYTWRLLGDDKQHFSNMLIDKHPLDWLVNTKRHEKEVYVLLSYNEISKEQYQAYSDSIN